MREKLLSLNVDKILSIDEAVDLSAYGRRLEEEYERLGITTPTVVVNAINALREEIGRRTKADKMAELNRINAELDGYKTVGEKKSAAQARLAALQKELGLTATARAR